MYDAVITSHGFFGVGRRGGLGMRFHAPLDEGFERTEVGGFGVLL